MIFKVYTQKSFIHHIGENMDSSNSKYSYSSRRDFSQPMDAAQMFTALLECFVLFIITLVFEVMMNTVAQECFSTLCGLQNLVPKNQYVCLESIIPRCISCIIFPNTLSVRLFTFIQPCHMPVVFFQFLLEFLHSYSQYIYVPFF